VFLAFFFFGALLEAFDLAGGGPDFFLMPRAFIV
jgi:hypothetical protein